MTALQWLGTSLLILSMVSAAVSTFRGKQLEESVLTGYPLLLPILILCQAFMGNVWAIASLLFLSLGVVLLLV